jgi:transcriptional regulator with XRE-family HTH domain
MQYDGYKIGPILRNLRTSRHISVETLSEKTGISTSAIKQIEQGGRNLSMKNLYRMMDVYEVDANTILDVKETTNEKSVDERLRQMNPQQREYFTQSFLYMLEHVDCMLL